MADANTARIESQVRQRAANWLDTLAPDIHAGVGSPIYPLSVLLLSSAVDGHAARIEWCSLCTASTPDHPDGWVQALHLSRDLLLLLARLDTDFQLGLSKLPAALAQHPLLVATPPGG